MPLVLYSLFALALFPILMAWIGAYFRVKEFGRFDNNHPRQQQSQLTGAGARAIGAQANSWEALQVFTVVVFIAYVAGVDLASLDQVSLLFLALRALYALLYLMNLALWRSIVYSLGMACCIYIFVVAVQQAAA